jgi:hypothetical protein
VTDEAGTEVDLSEFLGDDGSADAEVIDAEAGDQVEGTEAGEASDEAGEASGEAGDQVEQESAPAKA